MSGSTKIIQGGEDDVGNGQGSAQVCRLSAQMYAAQFTRTVRTAMIRLHFRWWKDVDAFSVPLGWSYVFY